MTHDEFVTLMSTGSGQRTYYYVPELDQLVHCNRIGRSLEELDLTVFDWYCKYVDRPTCMHPECNNPVQTQDFFRLSKGWDQYCSNECAQHHRAINYWSDEQSRINRANKMRDRWSDGSMYPVIRKAQRSTFIQRCTSDVAHFYIMKFDDHLKYGCTSELDERTDYLNGEVIWTVTDSPLLVSELEYRVGIKLGVDINMYQFDNWTECQPLSELDTLLNISKDIYDEIRIA